MTTKSIKKASKKVLKIAKTSKILDHVTGSFKPLHGGYTPMPTILALLGLPTDGTKADGVNVVDIGAGWGVYALPIAQATTGTVYAVEVGDNMIKAIARDAAVMGIDNVVALKGSSTSPCLPEGVKVHAAICNLAAHGIPDRRAYWREFRKDVHVDARLVIGDSGPGAEDRYKDVLAAGWKQIAGKKSCLRTFTPGDVGPK